MNPGKLQIANKDDKIDDRAQSFVLRSYKDYKTKRSYWPVPQSEVNSYCVLCNEKKDELSSSRIKATNCFVWTETFTKSFVSQQTLASGLCASARSLPRYEVSLGPCAFKICLLVS